MRWLYMLLAVVGLATLGVVGLIVGKYDTTSACEAAAEAVRQETPAILAELSGRDDEFARADRATRPFPRLREAIEGRVAERAAERAALKLENRSALECAGMVVYREIDPEGFRERAAERVLERREELRGGS